MKRDAWPWICAAIYAAAYFLLGAIRYAGHANYVDLGIFAQTSASAFGCFCNTIEGSHWAVHFSPILYVAGALLSVWHSALSLVALQAVAGAMTIPPVYALVERHADRRAARLAAIVVLLYPPLGGVTFNDFHENGLAPAAIAWLLWSFDRGYTIGTVLFALLALSVKEDQALFLAIAGTIGAYAYRRDALRQRLCGGIALVSACTFAAYFVAIAPHAASGGAWQPQRFYAWTADDVRALFPGGLLTRIGFLLLAFVPLLFLPFRVPAIVIAIVPLAEVLASRYPTTFTIGSHYAGAWAGYVLYAFAIAVAVLWRRSPHGAHRALYWCIALCVLEFASADPLHPGQTLHGRAPRDAALDALLAQLPANASIATQEEAYTHLAATDANATLLPETDAESIRTCYVLTDTDFPNSPRLVESRGKVDRLIASGVYRVVKRDGGITLSRDTSRCRD